ncbi:MAG: cation:proton antiporter, partial [Rhodospirillales bacterium]
LSSKAGRIAVGVLIAQDLAVVPLLVIVGSLGGEGGIGAGLIIKLLLAVGFLIFLILRLRKKRLELPFQLARGSVELLTLTGLGCCFAAAALAGLLGLSAGFGAFLAGLVIGNSTDREPIMHACHPIQALLLMIFFLSVGLLLDMGYLIDNLPAVLALLCVVTVFKTALNLIILRLMGRPWPEAATASLVLAQIGEFSFLLAITGLGAGVLTNGEDKLIIAVTVLSLALSPLWVMAARRLHGLARPGMLTLGQTARMALEAETAIMDMRFHEAGLFLGFWRRRLIETATETWATLRERLR